MAEPGATPKQRAALAMVKRADTGEAYLTAAASFTESGGVNGRNWTQAFIHYRTAFALRDQGLVRIEGQGEAATIYLEMDGAP